MVAFDLLDTESEGYITPASITGYLGESIDQHRLRQSIFELRSKYDQSRGIGYIASDGLGKSIFLEAWHEAYLSSRLPPQQFGFIRRDDSESSISSAMDQGS